MSLALIAKYCALIEPVANALQSVKTDLNQFADHVNRIATVVRSHRENAKEENVELLAAVQTLAESIGQKTSKNSRATNTTLQPTPS